MFVVLRVGKKAPVSLEVLYQEGEYCFKEMSTDMVVPLTQNLGSLIADKVMDMPISSEIECGFSVGSEYQELKLVREGGEVGDFTILDEDGIEYLFIDSPLSGIMSTAQAQALEDWRALEDRRASRP